MSQVPGPSMQDGDDVPASFFDAAHDLGDDHDALADEWAAAALTSRTFAPERASHLGGPARRVVGAMPARTITLKRREVVEVVDEAQFPRAPTEEERARTARRNLLNYTDRVKPGEALLMLAVIVALLSFFVFLFSARLLG